VGCSFCIVDVRILGNNLDFPVGRSFFSMLAMMVCSLFSVLRSFLLMTTRLALWLSKAFVAESLSLQLQLIISNQPTFSVPPYFHLHILPTRIADWPESDQTTRLRPTPPISMTTSLTHRFLQLAKKKQDQPKPYSHALIRRAPLTTDVLQSPSVSVKPWEWSRDGAVTLIYTIFPRQPRLHKYSPLLRERA
jgi:hypothetical protein